MPNLTPKRNDPDATKSKTVACARCGEDRHVPSSVGEPYVCIRCRHAQAAEGA